MTHVPHIYDFVYQAFLLFQCAALKNWELMGLGTSLDYIHNVHTWYNYRAQLVTPTVNNPAVTQSDIY